jgi:hypothetical protein
MSAQKVDGRRLFSFYTTPVVEDRLREVLTENWDHISNLVRGQLESEGAEDATERDADLASISVELVADDVDSNEWQRVVAVLRRTPTKERTVRIQKLLASVEVYEEWALSDSPLVKLKEMLIIEEPEFAMFSDLATSPKQE